MSSLPIRTKKHDRDFGEDKLAELRAAKKARRDGASATDDASVPVEPKKKKATKRQRLVIARDVVWLERKMTTTRRESFDGEAEMQVGLRSMRRGAADFVEVVEDDESGGEGGEEGEEDEEMGGLREYDEYELEEGERRIRGWSEERDEELLEGGLVEEEEVVLRRVEVGFWVEEVEVEVDEGDVEMVGI